MYEPPATLSCALDPFGPGDAFGMRVAMTTTSPNANDLDDRLRASKGRLSNVQPNPWDGAAGWLRQPKMTRQGPPDSDVMQNCTGASEISAPAAR